ncbi:MAG: sugar ABC transporter substrate-binding protein [Opitutaceae bacterium]|nr:sugar ABC transporter substrate-binding protein [Opitutaceae bacterium]
MLPRIRAILLSLAVLALAVTGFWWSGHSHEPPPAPGRKLLTWVHFVSPFKSYYERQVAEFQRLHPDIEVRMILVPMSEYHMKFKTLAAAGQAPDLFYSGDVWLSYLLPFMRDLTPLVERDAAEIGLDDFFPEIRAALQHEGRYYVMPEHANVALLYYNRRLFREAGLPEPTEDWTWDDLVRNAVALTRPATADDPGVWGCGRQEGWWGEWLTYVRQAGGTVFTADGRRCALDSPEAIAGLRFFQEKALKHQYSAPAGFEPLNGFVNERLAMVMVGHVNFWPNYNQITGLDWDIQLLPAGPASRSGGELAIAGYGINRNTPYPEETWALLKFLTRKEAAMEVMRHGSISPRRSVAEAQIHDRNPGGRPRNIAAAYKQIQYALPIPRHPHYIEIMIQIVQPEVDRMVQGVLTPEEAAHRAADGVNAYLATFDKADP